MRESIKAILGLLLGVGVLGCISVFLIPELQGTGLKWALFGVGLVLAVGSAGGLLKMQMQKDLAPDFLFEQTGTYFDRDGFCFNFQAGAEGGVCFIHVVFQNRYDRPVQGRVALQPARELFMRAGIPVMGVDIECPAGGFGMARIPWSVPAKYQGKKQKFDVGASVFYPGGKGKMLRYRSGIFLRASAEFGDAFSKGVGVAGLAVGAIVISTPASVTFRLPENVAEVLPADAEVKTAVVWKCGDAMEGRGGT